MSKGNMATKRRGEKKARPPCSKTRSVREFAARMGEKNCGLLEKTRGERDYFTWMHYK